METTLEYLNTDNLLHDSRAIIESARSQAYMAINTAMVERNWLLGKRIAEEELKGKNRAEYGSEIIKRLARELTALYGKGFTKTNLYQFSQFYKYFPKIFHAVSGKSNCLLSQYYFRLLQSQHKDLVESEMKLLTAPLQGDKLEFIKNPVVAEFLGLSPNSDFTETELEKNILANLQKFLMEMGKGYAFVARQQHIHTEKQDYYIDLVFYNYILKCFVLIDLKTSKITYQDIGQMDMYIRMYDELKRTEGDNPTLGIVLCADTDEDIARYSILKGNEQLFATKYKLYLPSEEELRKEIERQKSIYYLQHGEEAKL